MKTKKESFFWTSYSDLMTSLFFIMLVLFVLVIVLLYKRMEATEVELNAIKEVVESTKDLDDDYFEYRDDYKKFILKVKCQFPRNEHDIELLSPITRNELIEAGREVKSFLDNHKNNQYLVIIEGQASRNSADMMEYNYGLSFRRAMSLRRFWEYEGISFNSTTNCEFQISGSGDGTLNVNSMREHGENEHENQRFLIYIIPKNIIQE